MNLTLGIIEVVSVVIGIIFVAIGHVVTISRWRAEVDQRVKFLIDEDKILHGRIEKRDEQIMAKLDAISGCVHKLELRAAHLDGMHEGIEKEKGAS